MKKLIFVFVALLATQAVRAEWLLWQVVQSDIADIQGVEAGNVFAAQIGYAWGTSDSEREIFSTIYTMSGTDLETSMTGIKDSDTKDLTSYSVKVDLSSIDTPSGFSYFIELINNEGTVLARTKASGGEYTSYTSLAAYRVGSDVVDVPQAGVWHGGTFEAVPEPSSMMLLMLGAGLVGLRRKLKKGKKEKRA